MCFLVTVYILFTPDLRDSGSSTEQQQEIRKASPYTYLNIS